MCGIFGYIGRKTNSASIILDGLRVLEYRGYDSWGVAIVTQNTSKLMVQKKTGKIADSKLTQDFSKKSANIGIGHTRWATHGGVTVPNAHPHTDCNGRFAVVHNGIVENYESIKKDLIKNKHVFLSDTDTEVIAHLIEENIKKYDFAEAVRVSFNLLSGLSAIVVLDSVTNTIVAAKNGSPLLIGEKNGEYFIASDISAITPHTNKILFLKDYEMAVIDSAKGVKVSKLSTGAPLLVDFEVITYVRQNETLGRYKHFMIKEISEQSKVLQNTMVNNLENVVNLAKLIKKRKNVFFIAAGTAHNAGLAGAYLISKKAKIPIFIELASEFNRLEYLITKESLVVALSQSGETIDVLEPVIKAKEQGAEIAALTNAIGSSLYRMSDVQLLLGAGVEKAVASTKAYIAKLGILLLTAYVLNGQEKEAGKLLSQASTEISKMLSPEYISHIKKLAKKLKSADRMFVIGRGMSYPTAIEAALKIKEVSYVHAEGFAGGELKHGTIALIEKGTPCVVFAPHDETYESIISNAMEIKARGGYIIGVSSENSSVFDYFLEVKDLGDATIISQIVPLQLLAYYLALARGLTDPDKPRNLAKSVTVK